MGNPAHLVPIDRVPDEVPSSGPAVRIYDFPGVNDDVGDRPGTFQEYLASAGLAPQTVVNYSYFLRRGLEECEQMGVDLHTADAETLLTMADRVTNAETSGRKTLGAALSHWFRWQGVDDPPHWVGYRPTNVKVLVPGDWDRSGTYEAYLVTVGISKNTIRAYA